LEQAKEGSELVSATEATTWMKQKLRDNLRIPDARLATLKSHAASGVTRRRDGFQADQTQIEEAETLARMSTLQHDESVT
jgi:hypothetical protein